MPQSTWTTGRGVPKTTKTNKTIRICAFLISPTKKTNKTIRICVFLICNAVFQQPEQDSEQKSAARARFWRKASSQSNILVKSQQPQHDSDQAIRILQCFFDEFEEAAHTLPPRPVGQADWCTSRTRCFAVFYICLPIKTFPTHTPNTKGPPLEFWSVETSAQSKGGFWSNDFKKGA